MTIYFQSLCSGSSGNSLLIKNATSTLLIDAGFSSMKGCRQALENILPEIDGVVVSHLHTDHIHHYSLRVLQDYRIPVYIYEGDIGLLAQWHFRKMPFLDLKLCPFMAKPFSIGNFSIHPFPVPHDGIRKTFGFEISSGRGGKQKRIVVATDFCEGRALGRWFENADFIYVEANHDPQLLRQYPNPRSYYHLSNDRCGRLLRNALDKSAKMPSAVMLGHLSEIRNRPEIAEETVLEILDEGGYKDINLHIAPRYNPSEPVAIR